MNAETAKKLKDINRQFYQSFAQPFSQTRRRLQPGVKRIMAEIPPTSNILDLGCGNGELWRGLQRQGFQGSYVGIDFSLPILSAVVENLDGTAIMREPITGPLFEQALGRYQACFFEADLTIKTWYEPYRSRRFDLVTAFATLHHIPGENTRLDLVHSIHQLLQDGECFHLSVWQFLNSQRLTARIQPWQKVGISPQEVEPGDYLLDWKLGGYGLRYVHHFTAEELANLAESGGFRVQLSFLSDGEGGRLGLYQTWVKSG